VYATRKKASAQVTTTAGDTTERRDKGANGPINTHGNKGDRYEAELDNVAKEQQNFVAKIPQKSSSSL
jgi:hypothetical protein